MFPFYGLTGGTFSSKTVTSISVICCSDQGQVYPILKTTEKHSLQNEGFRDLVIFMSTTKAPVEGYLW